MADGDTALSGGTATGGVTEDDSGYMAGMSRILEILAVVLFVLVAISAFSDDINLNEIGWLALGLAAWAAAPLVPATVGAPGARRGRILR